MQITEVLISYYANAIAEQKALKKKKSEQKKSEQKKSEQKKSEQKIVSKKNTIMKSDPPVKSTDSLRKPAKKKKLEIQADESVNHQIFGLESADNSWVDRLKEVNPAAYQNLRDWD